MINKPEILAREFLLQALRSNTDAHVPKLELYRDYSAWTEGPGISQKKFNALVQEHFAVLERRENQLRVWRGVEKKEVENTSAHVLKQLTGEPDPRPKISLLDASVFEGRSFKIGLVSDTHLGSRWERLDALYALYDVFYQELTPIGGVKRVFHAGNLVEGDARHNKFSVKVRGVEAQTNYAVDNYPQRDGLETFYITGDDHEGWWNQREGIDWGSYFERTARAAGRDDLHYLGHVEEDVKLEAESGEAVMRIMHPGGGSSYALSYTSQKLVESFTGGEKPHLLVSGHYHKFDFCYPREVWVVQPGCFQDQTEWMRKKKLQAHVGGCVLTINQAPTGELNRVQVEFFPFYDRGFYERKFGFDGDREVRRI